MIQTKTLHILKDNQDHNPCVLAQKIVCIDTKFSKPVVFYRGKNPANKFNGAFLEEYDYCQKVTKNILIKSLSCLQKVKIDFSQVIDVEYVKNYSLIKIKK